MNTWRDPSGLYVCIRGPIIGYGDTSESAEAMADAIMAMQAELARIQKARIMARPRYRLNIATMRYEMVIE